MPGDAVHPLARGRVDPLSAAMKGRRALVALSGRARGATDEQAEQTRDYDRCRANQPHDASATSLGRTASHVFEP
jgi:hypothetical protein